MTNQQTINKLIEMHLTAMAEAYRNQLDRNDFLSLTFEERMGLLVDVEYDSRKNNRLARLIKAAGFEQPQASIADINYTSGRKLDKQEILRLASGDYITNRHNIIIVGPTGNGKTYLGCAFGMEACKQFHTVKYVRLPDLLLELAVAREEGKYKRVIQSYHKVNLLIIDEWLLVPLKQNEASDLLEIIHSRHRKLSTIFCSQFSKEGWIKRIGDVTLADSLMDRIVHDSYVIEIKNDPSKDISMREVYGIKNNR